MTQQTNIAAYAENLMNALQSLYEGKATLAEIQSIERSELEALYAVGYQLLACGKAKDAATVFRVLCTLDHLTVKHWIALAAAEQAQRQTQAVQVALAAVDYLTARQQLQEETHE